VSRDLKTHGISKNSEREKKGKDGRKEQRNKKRKGKKEK
jgi:hypothetical protein